MRGEGCSKAIPSGDIRSPPEWGGGGATYSL